MGFRHLSFLHIISENLHLKYVCMFFKMWLPLKITGVGTVFYEISQVYEIS